MYTSSSSVATIRREHLLYAVIFVGRPGPRTYSLPGEDHVGPGGLPQGVLEQAVLEDLLNGHWSGVAGAHSYSHCPIFILLTSYKK